MKTILIDPFTKTITEHEYDGSLEAMYFLLDCQTVEAVYCNDKGRPLFKADGDCLFVDEEGLFVPNQEFFIIDDKPLAGRAMVVGTDEEGNNVEARVALADLEGRVVWANRDEVREYCQKRGF